jgi:nitroreductase
MESNIVLDTIRNRRTVRRYADRDVSDSQVKQLLLAAMAAPSALNRKPWHFLVIRDASTKKLIADTLRLHPYLEQAPVVLAALADISVSPAWKLDMCAAVENLLLAAESMGLGGAWVGEPGTTLQEMAEDLLRERALIPNDVKLFAFVALGYPERPMPPHELDDEFARTHVHYDTWEGLRLTGRWADKK